MAEAKNIQPEVTEWFNNHQRAIMELTAKQLGALEMLRLVHGVDQSYFLSPDYTTLVKQEPAGEVQAVGQEPVSDVQVVEPDVEDKA